MKIQIELSTFEADVLLVALRNEGLREGSFKKTCAELFRKIDDQLMTKLDEPPSVWGR